MKKLTVNFVMVLFLCCFGHANVEADITFILEVDPPVSASDTAFVSVSATSTSGDSLTGFNLPIDVGANGTGLPAVLSFNADPIQNEINNLGIDLNVAPFQTGIDMVDGIVNLSGATDIPLTLAPVKLFDLVLDVASSAPTGSFPVIFNSGGTFFNASGTAAGGGPATIIPPVAPGSVNIVANVPEPSSLALVLIGGCGVMLRRRKKNV